MSGCCSEPVFSGVSPAYKRILWLVIAINASLFGIELVAGVVAESQALQADALDFLGDSLSYGVSLWAIGKSLQVRSRAALFKGMTLVLTALWVIVSTGYRLLVLNSPDPLTMSGVAVAAFMANLFSVLLLLRFREGDANVRSVWLCSRNDMIGNLVVLVAASGVWYSGSAWPDLVTAALMAGLFLSSAWQITVQALAEQRQSARGDGRCITGQRQPLEAGAPVVREADRRSG